MINQPLEQLEQKIKECVKKERITYPANYEEYIEKLLERLPETKDKKQGRWRKEISIRPAFAVVALLILAISIPAGAVVHKHMLRLEEMEDGQVKRYITDLQNSKADGDSYSRKFTLKERKRKEKIKIAYEKGEMYPVKDVIIIQKQSQIRKNRICFWPSISKFYLPQRTLTDEEMLEIIDFYCKREYSLAKSKIKKDKRVDKKLEDVTSEARTRKLAEKWVREIYKADVAEWESRVSIKKVPDSDNTYYNVWFQNSNTKEKYLVEIDTTNETLIELAYANRKDSEANVLVSQKQIKEGYQTAVSVLKTLNITENVGKVTCEYSSDTDKKVYCGTVKYLFTLENQKGYVFCYNMNTEGIQDVVKIENVSLYRKMQIKSTEKNAKRHIVKMN